MRFWILFLLVIVAYSSGFAAAASLCRSTFFDFSISNTVIETPRLRVEANLVERVYQVFEKQTDRLIGVYRPNSIEFETWIRGRGYAAEAMIPILKLEFENTKNAELSVFAVTEMSQALFKKLGFRPLDPRDKEEVAIKYQDFARLLEKIDKQFGGNLERFSRPSKSIPQVVSAADAILLAVKNKDLSFIRLHMDRFLKENKDPELFFAEFYLNENRLEVVDFLSRHLDVLSDPALSSLVVAGYVDVLIPRRYADAAADSLLRTPPETQAKVLRDLKKFYLETELIRLHQIFYRILSRAQTHGLWLEETIPDKFRQSSHSLN